MANIFDDLLTNIAEGDREAFSGLVERNPSLKTYVADPAKVARVDEVDNWYANNWDFDHGCTKQEYARALRIQVLETQLAAAPSGDEMTLEQLNTFLDEKIASGTVVSAKQVKDELATAVAGKEAEFNGTINRLAAVSTEIPYLLSIHQRDLGEIFDPNELLTKANAAGATDLRAFYLKDFSGEARAARATAAAEASKAAHEAELAAARAEGRKEALQARVGESHVGNPSEDGSPDVGHFQLRLMQKAAPKAGEDGKPSEINSPLGTGITSAIRAREFERAKITGNAA